MLCRVERISDAVGDVEGGLLEDRDELVLVEEEPETSERALNLMRMTAGRRQTLGADTVQSTLRRIITLQRSDQQGKASCKACCAHWRAIQQTALGFGG